VLTELRELTDHQFLRSGVIAPATRGSLTVRTQRDVGFDFPTVLSRGVGYGKPQRDEGFEIPPTMGL
jgi:hypothetical protein